MSSDSLKASALVGSVLAVGGGVAAYLWNRDHKPSKPKVNTIKIGM